MAHDEALAARIRSRLDGAAERRMFGGLAFLVDGHMTITVSGSGGIMVRVVPDRAAELLTRPGASRMVMNGRELDGWLRVVGGPGEQADELDGEALDGWVAEAVAVVATLPPRTGSR
ncbi:TfoX/Sxy family protein [Pseudonocardia spirodelae]|uniref:TfoX/Sxy family protein n=1 Tax=Pseudonocardia spirodelae TaxID=3133431 RepID=A0ABU8TBN3_9PSEU